MDDIFQVRPMPGYEDYLVSKCGNVFSFKSGFIKHLKTKKNPDGYLCLALMKNGKRKDTSVHRCVAIAWVDNLNNKPQVNHIDGDKLNNHEKNLEWVSVAENNIHAIKVLGKRRGSNQVNSKLNEQDIIKIRCDNRKLKDIAKDYGVYFSTIHKIKQRKNWTHVGEDKNTSTIQTAPATSQGS